MVLYICQSLSTLNMCSLFDISFTMIQLFKNQKKSIPLDLKNIFFYISGLDFYRERKEQE